MWRIPSAIVVLLTSAPLVARPIPEQGLSTQMLTTVKRLYASFLPGSIRPYSDIKQAATPSLQRVLDKEMQVSTAIEGMACIDYDLTGLTDDQEETASLIRSSIRITPQPQGLVRVSFVQRKNQDPTVVYYKMACSSRGCLVDDISYSTPNNSLKREVVTCLRRYGR